MSDLVAIYESNCNGLGDNMTLGIILFVLFVHFVFDFMLQTDEMAINKSKSFGWLGIHSIAYAFWGIPISLIYGIPMFVVYLFITHFCIDGITSRITSYLWKNEKRHWFFVTIGFDQFLHYATIFWYLSLFSQHLR